MKTSAKSTLSIAIAICTVMLLAACAKKEPATASEAATEAASQADSMANSDEAKKAQAEAAAAAEEAKKAAEEAAH